MRGASLIEFGIIAGLVSVVSIAAVNQGGQKVAKVFCDSAVALGAELLCEADGGVTDPAQQGTDGQDFIDLNIPQGTTDPQTIMLSMGNAYVAPMTFRSSINEGQISSCRQAPADESPLCEPPSSSSETSIPSENYRAGYQIELPSDPLVSFTRTVALDFYPQNADPASGKSWTVNVHRPAEPVKVEPEFVFTDENFPAASDQFQWIMKPFTGEFNDRMRFTSDNGNADVCTQAVKDGPIDCENSSGTTSKFFYADEVYAVGYRVDFGGDDKVSSTYPVQLDLISMTDSSTFRSWNITVHRDADPIVVNPQFTFSDRSFAQGQTEQDHIMKPLSGDFNDDMSFRVSYSGSMAPRACVQAVEGGSIQCASTSANRSSVIVRPNNYAVGYLPSLSSDPNETQTTTATIELSSVKDNTINSTWDIALDRPGNPVVMNTSFAIPDKVLAQGEHRSGPFMYELTGDFNDQMAVRFDYNGSYAALCVQRVMDGPISCENVSNKKHVKIIQPDTYAVGYNLHWSYYGSNWNWNATFDFTMTSVNDPSKTIGNSFTVTRAAE
jgi:Flp pilus assembly pilin Flp